MTDLQSKILHIIQAHDRKHPISRDGLRGALAAQGIARSKRKLQDDIGELCEQGYGIVSGASGYWIATHAEDADAVFAAATTLYRHAESEREDAARLHALGCKLEGLQRKAARGAQQERLAL